MGEQQQPKRKARGPNYFRHGPLRHAARSRGLWCGRRSRHAIAGQHGDADAEHHAARGDIAAILSGDVAAAGVELGDPLLDDHALVGSR